MKYDVVIPLSNGSTWDNNELRYCLRSLAANVHQLGEIYILTPIKLPWLKNVHVVPASDPLKSNKDGNLINKVLKACSIDGLSDDFIRLSDDQLIVKPIPDIKMMKAFFLSNLKQEPGNWWTGKWKQRMKHTFDYLMEQGLPTFHFDSHCPMVYNKDKFATVWDGVDFESGIGFCINTFYFNHLVNPSFISQMQRIDGRIKATIESSFPVEKIQKFLAKDVLYLGYSNEGLNDHLKVVLDGLFPNKSRFEK